MAKFFVRTLFMGERGPAYRGDPCEKVQRDQQDARLDEWLNGFYPAEPVSIQVSSSGNYKSCTALFKS